MRLLLEYGDHNMYFSAVLPRAGTVERNIKSSDGGEWALFRPDAPVDYEGNVYHRFLLKSRWIGRSIGESKPTSVFILLVRDSQNVNDGFEIAEFHHVAWGMVKGLT